MTSSEVRGARGMLGMSAEELSRESGIGLSTIRRAECEASSVSTKSRATIIKTFARLGLGLHSETGRGGVKAGVYLLSA